jgi:integrase
MATFKACVQKQRSDGFFPVYMRVTHNRKIGYIKTDKIVSKKSLSNNNEIKDNFVLNYCTHLILEYNERLNQQDTTFWSVKDVIDFLLRGDDDANFSDYAKLHIGRMINRNQDRTARNYKLAVAHLERFLGTTRVLFSYLTSSVIQKWILTLEKTHRAKEMYPICIRQIFKAALIELNDEEKGIVRIKYNPWLKVKIPHADVAPQIAISAEECREFFNRPLPQTKYISSLPELGRDVALLVLCLAGMNTVDLFKMKKSDYRNGVLCYNRSKTRHSRSDNAYFEIRVEPYIKPIFEKYLSEPNDEFLFNFHQRYCDSDSFCANVNNGIKKICKDMGLKKEDTYCVYTFRHTWGTVAQNDCGANLQEVALAMNHSHGMKVTRGYVKLDFTPAWELNAKVIDFIFFSTKKSKQGIAKDPDYREDKLFRISYKRMIYARAYFKGEVLAEVSDVGFNTIDSVIDRLANQLPGTIPNGCSIQFRIKDCDSGKEAVYERTKGKGF